MVSHSDSLNWVPPSLDNTPDPNGRGTIRRAEGEAAQQYLAKLAKLEAAREAILTRHLQEVAHDDIMDVRRLKAKHLGKEFASKEGESVTGGVVGDIIVCDDYNVNTEPRKPTPTGTTSASSSTQGLPGWLKALLVGGAIAAAAGGGFAVSQWLKPQASTQKIESHEGFLLELVPPK